MDLATVLIVVAFTLGVTPFAVYFSVKFGAFAFLRARQLFDETSKKGDHKGHE